MYVLGSSNYTIVSPKNTCVITAQLGKGTNAVGLGKLLARNYIDDGRVYFCPSATWIKNATLSSFFDLTQLCKPGSEVYSTYNYYMRFDYDYYIHFSEIQPKKIEDYRSSIILSDTQKNFTGVIIKTICDDTRNHRNGANIIHGDGSAAWIP